MTLSNDVPPNPNRAYRGCCRGPVILSHARWKRETLTLSVDVHANPGHPKTTMLHTLPLNVGGPHLSRWRWHRLLQEITASSPHIIALQEVRFRTCEAHLAYTTKACQNYQPLAHDDKRPDMMFFVHERVHKYCKLMAHCSPHAIALRVQIPNIPEFTFVNEHGPFTLREREALDAWIASVPNVGIVGGDFNDGIWHTSPRRRRIWHDLLDSGRLVDPQYQTVPQPQGPSHTRGGKRMDGLLLSQTTWNALTPVAYQATTFPAAGDHAGVEFHTTVVLPEPQSPDPEVISIRDWTGRDLKRFHAHMGRWYRGVPKNMTMETASNKVLKEVVRYVAANKKPDRRPDQAHQDLQTRLAKNHGDQAALKLWGEHMQRKRHTDVMKKLRRFRKSAIGSTGTFFADLATWLVKPAQVSSMSPTLASATKKLPDFAGDPQWDPEKAFSMLPNLRVPGTPVGQTRPTWREFQETANQPKKKSMGMDRAPPHTIQWLPENVQWI